jgi:hypothetical protein
MKSADTFLSFPSCDKRQKKHASSANHLAPEACLLGIISVQELIEQIIQTFSQFFFSFFVLSKLLFSYLFLRLNSFAIPLPHILKNDFMIFLNRKSDSLLGKSVIQSLRSDIFSAPFSTLSKFFSSLSAPFSNFYTRPILCY